MPPAPPVLAARGLRKSFRGAEAVRGVDLIIEPGQRTGLLGPNGAGKTTTLLMLLGAITPDVGTVEILGHRLPRQRSRALTDVGFAAGYLPLPDLLRVREALTIFGQLQGLRDPGPRIEATLERFGVAHLADAMCTELSSGQRTLVGIVKAVLHQPRLLVLDEPTASLDPDVAGRVRQAIIDICTHDGATLLVTSHNMAEVELLCDRVVFLKAGQVVADGPPAAVAAQFGDTDLEGVFLRLASDPLTVTHEAEAEGRPL